MFRMPETPYLNQNQPLSGGSLSAFFAELANARGTMKAESKEIPFHDYVSEAVKRLVSVRGGEARAKLRMRELGGIAAAFAGIPDLGPRVEELDENPDMKLKPVGDEFFDGVTVARGMMRLDGIFRGLQVIDQDCVPVYEAQLGQKLNAFVTSPRSEEQGAYNFIGALDEFNGRAFKTTLDVLKVMQIDHLRAEYYLSVRLGHARKTMSQLQERYWELLEKVAKKQGVTLDGVAAHEPRYFKEVDFKKSLRVRAVSPV